MSTIRKGFIRTGNVITLLAIGIWYAVLLRQCLSISVPFFVEEPGTSATKMLATGISSTISCLIVFLINYYCMRQNMRFVGIICGAAAFIHFYIMKSWPNFIELIFMSFHASYSLFAMLAFTCTPIVIGHLLNRKIYLAGLHEVFNTKLNKPIK